MYAIIETGGKQYRVKSGDEIDIEKLDQSAGEAVKFEKVLAVSDESGLKIGSPTVEGASVSAEVVEQFRGKKLIAFKKKRRQGYARKVGHRQNLTKVKITEING